MNEPQRPSAESATNSTHANPHIRSLSASVSINRTDLILLLIVVAFSMLLRAGIDSIPLERDEGEYAYIAKRWLEGDLPYRDAFNQKTPGIFVAYAALFATGLQSVEAIHWLGHGALVGTLIFVYLLGRKLFSGIIGCVAALFTVILVMDASVLGNAANTEVFAILPLSAAIYFTARAGDSGRMSDCLFTGICGGLALCFKQVTLSVVVLSFAWILWRWWAARKSQPTPQVSTPGDSHSIAHKPVVALLGPLILGLALVLVPTCIYFIAHGAWSEFYDCVAGHNMVYASRVPIQVYGENYWNTSKFHWIVFLPIQLAALAGLYFAWIRGDVSIRLCLWWWLASFVAVSAGGYFRPHYFQLLMPPLALIAAYGLGTLVQVLEPRRLGWQTGIAAGLAFAGSLWPLSIQRNYYLPISPELISRALYEGNPFPESPAIGQLIKENTAPDDRVFVMGSEPQILFFADRRSASRYIIVYPLFASADSLGRQKEVMEGLRRDPPRIVVMVNQRGVPKSYALSPDSPQYLINAVETMLQEDYTILAASAVAIDGTSRIIEPKFSEQGRAEIAHGSGEFVTILIFQYSPNKEAPTEPKTGAVWKFMQGQLQANLSDVRKRMARAAEISGRRPDDVQLVAVTKQVDAPVADELWKLGVRDLGESRPQELWRKHELLSPEVRWHLIGPLQKNKARRTLPMIDWIHSVDSVPLLWRLDELAVELDLMAKKILLEVNVSGESTKHGFRPSDLAGVLVRAAELKRVSICGLMTMAPYDEDPDAARPYFAALRKLRDKLRDHAAAPGMLTELSMGMSGDFEVAIEEGATIVRIGSALFHGIGALA